MNKPALVFALVAVTALMSPAQQPASSTWVTVDNFSLVNQTQAIAPTAIYGPTMAGLYRISYYIEAVAATLTMNGDRDSACVTMNYTDDSGQVQLRMTATTVCAEAAIVSDGTVSFSGAGDVFVIRSKAAPITLTVTHNDLRKDFTYNITGTIERLTKSN